MLQEIVSRTLEEQQLIRRGEHIIVALSGGADSVCLLHVLLALRETYQLKLSAVHINHRLRGEEADRDEAFVRELCKQQGIPCFCKCFDVAEYARSEKMGTEEAGRKLRYACFEEYRRKLHADSVATAHHRDDNIETFFLHLLRGAGLHGLTGIPYRNQTIIRPLLAVSKEEILEYLADHKLSFVTDSTNHIPNVLRNKIRLELLPLLEQYNPGLRGTLTRNMKLFHSADGYLRQTTAERFSALAEQKESYLSFSLSALEAEAPAIRYGMYSLAIASLLPHTEVGSERIFEIDRCMKQKNGAVSITESVSAQVFYDRLYFVKRSEHDVTAEYLLPLNQIVRLTEPRMSFFATKTTKTTEKPIRNTLFLSVKKTENQPIRIRFRKNGDFFYPLGFGHRKSLQNFFVDLKIPRFLRDTIPLITVGDEIAWVCGYRADMRFLPDSEENIRIEIKYTEEKNER